MNARYHVLGGTLSPLDGIGPDDLNIKTLVARVAEGGVAEVDHRGQRHGRRARRRRITSPTSSPASACKVTRLAHGVPVGGELDYLDEGTLAAALRSRTAF